MNTDSLFSMIIHVVQAHMANYDASHDFSHIHRVVRLAHHIHRSEQSRWVERPSSSSSTSNPYNYDTNAITLAALLHDVSDRKYLPPGQDASSMAQKILLDHGAGGELADKVQIIVTHVSYSSEIQDPDRVREITAQYPELAIVQDADRLDALGAVGIGRCFTFGGAKGLSGGMEDSVQHFEEKLEKLEGMMKTETGMEIARKRTERLRVFRGWWVEEVGSLDSPDKV